jgi:hypothetical protein
MSTDKSPNGPPGAAVRLSAGGGPVWYEARVPRPARAVTLGAGLCLAVLLLVTGCTGAAPQVARWMSGPPAVPGPAGSAGGAPALGVPRPVPGKVMLGAYLALSGLDGAQSLALRRRQLGRDLRVLHRYYTWSDQLPDGPGSLPPGTILMISWNGAPYGSITGGSQDALIAHAADALARYHRSVFLRFAWDMNGNGYSWSGARNGDNAAGYVTAWRHVHDIFAAHHVTNVAWVWAPAAASVPAQSWNDAARYYPGDRYVDWVGVGGYLGDRVTPESLFGGIVRGYGGRKPVMIAETAAPEKGGTAKADWIGQLAAWIVAHPPVGALVWFDTDKDKGAGKDWRIDSTPAALAAYRKLADDPRFGA